MDVSIEEIANMIKDVVGYKGKVIFDTTKQDCMPQKLIDGLRQTYQWYLTNISIDRRK